MDFTYTDGSGNGFSISRGKLDYSPVKPQFSSSGIYDGGDPSSIELSTEDEEKLTSLALRAFESISGHSERREMGCGTLRLEGESIFLKRNARSKEELEQALKSFL